LSTPLPTDAAAVVPVSFVTPKDPGTLAELRQLDEAVDYAARVSRATVSEFLAAPTAAPGTMPPAIELAVEFFVPPTSAEVFARELDRALIRRSPAYAAARRAGEVEAIRVQVIPAGTFHQWRSAWKVSPRCQHEQRWSSDRRLLEGLLHQARTGWREVGTVA
jgi:hypothetical protein